MNVNDVADGKRVSLSPFVGERGTDIKFQPEETLMNCVFMGALSFLLLSFASTLTLVKTIHSDTKNKILTTFENGKNLEPEERSNRFFICQSFTTNLKETNSGIHFHLRTR